ncbi:MAG: hypothetical protein IPN20_00095 [Haliscomenobacter sp.]|nr:hypothetical protein [Haliscomenobacter sp.]
MQQEANKVLEEKVQERTLQLAEAYEELSSTMVVIEQERQKSDRLLLNILPEETAAELKEKDKRSLNTTTACRCCSPTFAISPAWWSK